MFRFCVAVVLMSAGSFTSSDGPLPTAPMPREVQPKKLEIPDFPDNVRIVIEAAESTVWILDGKKVAPGRYMREARIHSSIEFKDNVVSRVVGYTKPPVVD